MPASRRVTVGHGRRIGRGAFLRLGGAGLAGAALLAAAGCVRAAGDGGEAAGEATVGGTRTFEHALGRTEIPAAPRRVVVMNVIAFDAAAALGLAPVASVSNVTSIHGDQLEDVEALLDPEEPSLEEIAALEPDLILNAAYEGELFLGDYEQLSRIAPTVAFDFVSDAEWKRYFRFYADALGRSDEAERMLADYDARVARTREGLGPAPAETEVAVLQVREDFVENYRREGSFSDSILDEVGFGGPKGLPEEQVSRELLPDLGADDIFFFTSASGEVEAERVNAELEELRSNPLWRKNEAVMEDRAYKVEDHWFGFGVTAANAVLDDLDRLLLRGEWG
jgi:iron complex transport system substrate-binding protein